MGIVEVKVWNWECAEYVEGMRLVENVGDDRRGIGRVRIVKGENDIFS